MTRVLGALLLALILAPGQARAGDLTLRDVIELHRAGLGEDLLVAVIEADGGPFKLSYAEILDLKSDGLSERVITTLVRTGSRRSAASVSDDGQGMSSAGTAGPVIVEQEVTQVAPTVVAPTIVVVDTGDEPGREWRHRDSRGVRGNHMPAQVPPATWTTRRDDGRNISSGGGTIRSGKPAATWVTPNDIRTAPPGFHPGNQDTPRRREDTPSRRDRNDRSDDTRRDGDRKPRP